MDPRLRGDDGFKYGDDGFKREDDEVGLRLCYGFPSARERRFGFVLYMGPRLREDDDKNAGATKLELGPRLREDDDKNAGTTKLELGPRLREEDDEGARTTIKNSVLIIRVQGVILFLGKVK
ncbi:MAG: hypothetical protein P8M49_10765 [Thalassotalea sp.]|nr:hypothetical protein [Thalassotalea sp.]